MKPLDHLRKAYDSYTNFNGEYPKRIRCSKWFYFRYAASLKPYLIYRDNRQVDPLTGRIIKEQPFSWASHTYCGTPVMWDNKIKGSRLIMETK